MEGLGSSGHWNGEASAEPRGYDRIGEAAEAMQGQDRLGRAALDRVGLDWLGRAWRGSTGPECHREERKGTARQPWRRQQWPGTDSTGGEPRGTAALARLRGDRLRKARPGMAAKARSANEGRGMAAKA